LFGREGDQTQQYSVVLNMASSVSPGRVSNQNILLFPDDTLTHSASVLKSLLATCGRVPNPPDPSNYHYSVSDVIFHVGGESFYASKAILVARLEYFKAMFVGGLKESKISEIDIEDVSAEVFWIVLQFLCSGQLQQESIDIEMAGQMYNYGDMIQLEDLKSLIMDLFKKLAAKCIAETQPDIALQLWNVFASANITILEVNEELDEFVLQFIPVLKDVWQKVQVDCMKEILENDYLHLSEIEILNMALDWCKYNTIVEMDEDTEGDKTEVEPELKEKEKERKKRKKGEEEKKIQKEKGKGKKEDEEDNEVSFLFRKYFVDLIRWENMDIGQFFLTTEKWALFKPGQRLEIMKAIAKSQEEPFKFFELDYQDRRYARERNACDEFLNAVIKNDPVTELRKTPTLSEFVFKVSSNFTTVLNLQSIKLEDCEYFLELSYKESSLACFIRLKTEKIVELKVEIVLLSGIYRKKVSFIRVFQKATNNAWGWPTFERKDRVQTLPFFHVYFKAEIVSDITFSSV